MFDIDPNKWYNVKFADIDHGSWKVAAWEMHLASDTFRLISPEDATVSQDHFITALDFDILGIENAHFHVKEPLSRAQVYTEAQLQAFYDRVRGKGTVIGFPGRLTRPAIKETGRDKDTDHIALGEYWYANFQRTLPNGKLWGIGFNVLTSPYPSEAKQAELAAAALINHDINILLNKMRADDDAKYNKHPLANVIQFAVENLYNDASAETRTHLREFFGVQEKLHQDGSNRIKLGRMKQWSYMFSLWLACRDGDNNIRRNPRGDFVGVDFLKAHIVGYNPYRVGGVVSGQFMHDKHGRIEKALDVTPEDLQEFQALLKTDVPAALMFQHKNRIEVRAKCIACAKKVQRDADGNTIVCGGHIPHMTKEDYRPLRRNVQRTVTDIIQAFRDFNMSDYDAYVQELAEQEARKSAEAAALVVRRAERAAKKAAKEQRRESSGLLCHPALTGFTSSPETCDVEVNAEG